MYESLDIACTYALLAAAGGGALGFLLLFVARMRGSRLRAGAWLLGSSAVLYLGAGVAGAATRIVHGEAPEDALPVEPAADETMAPAIEPAAEPKADLGTEPAAPDIGPLLTAIETASNEGRWDDAQRAYDQAAAIAPADPALEQWRQKIDAGRLAAAAAQAEPAPEPEPVKKKKKKKKKKRKAAETDGPDEEEEPEPEEPAEEEGIVDPPGG